VVFKANAGQKHSHGIAIEVERVFSSEIGEAALDVADDSSSFLCRVFGR
jgi:hypothetical protein